MSVAPGEIGMRLSALRVVSFVPHERDAVHVGLLTPDAQRVVDLAPLGIGDALEAIEQLAMLRQTAGAIVHGAARTAFALPSVHLVAPIPLVRSVVLARGMSTPHFADPATLHGPGGHLDRGDAAGAQVGLAAVVGGTLAAGSEPSDASLDLLLAGTVLVLGWPHLGPTGDPLVLPGAVGPFLAVPRRRPESLLLTHVAPLMVNASPDEKLSCLAPSDAEFFELARTAVRSHTLRPGDLLAIFPGDAPSPDARAVPGGSWVRVSAPGLGTLSLAVR